MVTEFSSQLQPKSLKRRIGLDNSNKVSSIFLVLLQIQYDY